MWLIKIKVKNSIPGETRSIDLIGFCDIREENRTLRDEGIRVDG